MEIVQKAFHHFSLSQNKKLFYLQNGCTGLEEQQLLVILMQMELF